MAKIGIGVGLAGVLVNALAGNWPAFFWAICATLWAFNAGLRGH